MIIAVDFDGTLVDHRFPDIGQEIPGAFKWLKKFKNLGAKIILWTMRSDGQKDGPVLTQAVEYCRKRGLEFDGINENPDQKSWTSSPKAYAHIYIDDAALGCPLRPNPRMGGRPLVDWSVVGEEVFAQLVFDQIDEAELDNTVESWNKLAEKIGEDGMLIVTRGIPEHPEGYEGPCLCGLCVSYGTNDDPE